MSERSRSVAQLLGYASDARLLIINGDDFGMCHAENAATIAALEHGAFTSATVMVPCPWFEDAAAYARRTPQADMGVHITHTSEWAAYKWGPVSGPSRVPSLVEGRGYFYHDVGPLYAHATLEDMERETRAQIDRALAAGMDVTHLDSHMGTVQLDATYHALYVRLAAEYQLPIRMAARSVLQNFGMNQVVEQADRLCVLAPDHFWYGGPAHPSETATYWTQRLYDLQPGVNEIYIHAAVDTPELRDITDKWAQRVADFEFFMAPSTRALLRECDITPIGYRPLRDLQRQLRSC
jgi:chitin disaccharide deacetylase